MSDIWTHWHGHPDALIGLTLLEGLYLLAVGPMRTRFGMTEAASPKELLSFTTGVMVIFMALLSPIHILSDQYLFSMHMFQHIMLTLIAPPLLILGVPARLLKPITSNKITPFMSFGKMPIANGFLKKEDFEKEFRSKNGKWISQVDL